MQVDIDQDYKTVFDIAEANWIQFSRDKDEKNRLNSVVQLGFEEKLLNANNNVLFTNLRNYFQAFSFNS